MFAVLSLPPTLITVIALLMVATVVALIAWALQLMQAASDRQEFSLMLAGCMVCSAAVGLATVTVITLSSPDHVLTRGELIPPTDDNGVAQDTIVLPWDDEPFPPG